MNYKYRITTHPASEISRIVYFCNEKGECQYDQVPSDQLKKLEDILNSEGKDGWELVQLSFGEDGVVGFWKKEG